jgi:hypothetical protein
MLCSRFGIDSRDAGFHGETGCRGSPGSKVLFLFAQHIVTEERGVSRFIEGTGRELQNRLCGIFLARDKAIAVEFEKQDTDYKAGTLVAIKERLAG